MLIKEDLAEILSESKKFISLSSSQITILGGTGFIGSWIVKTLQELNRNFQFNSTITVYTRNLGKARNLFDKYIDENLKLIETDFANGQILLNHFDYLINGATPTNSKTGLSDDMKVYDSSIYATNSIIASAKLFQNVPNVVNLSSGIVYGKQPIDMKNRLESSTLMQCTGTSGYMNAKIHSEELLDQADRNGLVNATSPRLFAFSGPGLPLDEHFAIGNFLSDALAGQKIKILANPSTIRSYMYPTDLTTWVLAALVKPPTERINIGSETPISMLDLANLISNMTTQKGVQGDNFTEAPSNYAPSTIRSRQVLAVDERVDLPDGITRWIKWLERRGS